MKSYIDTLLTHEEYLIYKGLRLRGIINDEMPINKTRLMIQYAKHTSVDRVARGDYTVDYKAEHKALKKDQLSLTTVYKVLTGNAIEAWHHNVIHYHEDRMVDLDRVLGNDSKYYDDEEGEYNGET